MALETKKNMAMGAGCCPRSLPPSPPAAWGCRASGRAHTAGERERRGRGQSTDAGAAQTGVRVANPGLHAGSRGARGASQVSGRPGLPSPLGHCQLRPTAPLSPGHRKCRPSPGGSIPEQMSRVSNLPRKGE